MLIRLLPCPLVLLLLVLSPVDAVAWHPRGKVPLYRPTLPAHIGKNRSYFPAPGETLMEIARRAGLGYRNLIDANPGTDPWKPPLGQPVLLPLKAEVPAGLDEGITIDLAAMRLWWARHDHRGWQLRWYPIGIGREGFSTPAGRYAVTVVVEKPTWFPPESLRAIEPELPPAVPPGSDNPLGNIWIGTTAPGIGIHGTNRPFGVGRRVSHGCIRMYPEDIQDLASRVQPGTPILILAETP